MKKKKLKSYVLPSLYACFFVGVLLVTIGVANILTKKTTTDNHNENINYVSESIIDTDEPVVKEVSKMLKPYTNENVKVGKYYYDYKADESRQQNSITYHDNTYMQNSGVDYILEEVFEVNSVMDGTVTNVTEDELLGKCVEIKHDNNYTSIYQSLSEVTVKKGDKITAGQIIGKSGQNALDKDMGNHLHLEEPVPELFQPKHHVRSHGVPVHGLVWSHQPSSSGNYNDAYISWMSHLHQYHRSSALQIKEPE